MGGRGSGSASGASRIKEMAKYTGSAAEYHAPFENPSKSAYNKTFSKASFKYETDYKPYAFGQISKTDAGQLYKAAKNGDVKVLPETTRSLYNQADANIRYASERYSSDHQYYDSVASLTHSLLNKDYKRSQAIINEIEYDNIKRSGKKSEYYKYRQNLK